MKLIIELYCHRRAFIGHTFNCNGVLLNCSFVNFPCAKDLNVLMKADQVQFL